MQTWLGRVDLFLKCKVCKQLLEKCKRLFTFALLTVCLSSQVAAEEDFALLIVARESGIAQARALKLRCEELRNKLRISASEMAIYLHLVTGKDAWNRRLGLEDDWYPVLGVALWNETATLGPRRFVGDSFVKNATQHDALRVVQSCLRLSPYKERSLPPFHEADTLPTPLEQSLTLERVRFEASGKPNNLTNFGVRLRNDSLNKLTDIRVVFFVRRAPAEVWQLCGEKTLEKIASHHFATADFVGKTRELGLTDTEGNAVSCQYKVEVSAEGLEPIVMRGSFQPSEEPVD